MSKIKKVYRCRSCELIQYGVTVFNDDDKRLVLEEGIPTSHSYSSELNTWIIKHNLDLVAHRKFYSSDEVYPQYIKEFGVTVNNIGEKVLLLITGKSLWGDNDRINEYKMFNITLLKENTTLTTKLCTPRKVRDNMSDLAILIFCICCMVFCAIAHSI